MAYNAPSAATECLCTTVRNLNDHATYFGFLGRPGKTLAAHAEVSIWGSITSWLLRYTPDVRAQRSLAAALAADVLAIVQTPAVHLWDDALYVTKVLTLSSSTLADTDPCWGSFKSSSDGSYYP
jgi:hypothetical protein